MLFQRNEHNTIVGVLASMNQDLLVTNKCWFGGGTAIVLKHGEYRKSLDLDFLCADGAGYRELRNAFFEQGIHALFTSRTRSLRDVQADGYGIRVFIEHEGLPIKFEIVREVRIELDGAVDPLLQVPTLSPSDMFAEKLLANADRCYDRAVAYRDAIDLGRLVEAYGHIPDTAVAKAEKAYGRDVPRKAMGILNHLQKVSELRYAASVLDMDEDAAISAIASLRRDCIRIWPEAGILRDPDPEAGEDFGM
ncbi:hypothetical protein GGQ99_005122 [Aminobacter niigataensis]|uniref:Nucleotidyl transferase AbiEii toxin, Type IV TA system n=1 Tax=Aminobacter niigataensis TaxID=83265 RepID=A0ABR6L950_9HYPH|nr:nucleotidyl transferase AbiEii/AbiGii toxin family protein [Aminobacter niigataensis]MBB4653332.1 hypothetical protein [Aminobacter niigataensis]